VTWLFPQPEHPSVSQKLCCGPSNVLE